MSSPKFKEHKTVYDVVALILSTMSWHLSDIAYDISQLLEAIKNRKLGLEQITSGPSGPIIYLAETTLDLNSQRDIIKRQLQKRGCLILPDKPLPLNAGVLTEQVRGDLHRCTLSIHMIGENYGVVPEGETRSLAEIQHEFAIDRGRKEAFSRLIWLPPGLQAQDERQRIFIDSLKKGTSSQMGVDLLQTALGEFKIYILDKLSKRPSIGTKPDDSNNLRRDALHGDQRVLEVTELPPGFEMKPTAIEDEESNEFEAQIPSNPFPGLRPFASHENHLFFGRDGQSHELLRKLRRNRFVAVVGTSGSGKSSLVHAGLLPALRRGQITHAGSDWRIAVLRPGHDPISNMARALNAPEVFAAKKFQAIDQATIFETTLRCSDLGLVEIARQVRMASYENLLIVVDQFEELFRFKQVSRDDEAAAFVTLLLEATKNDRAAIHVVLTMRSDFLGDCAQFRDLPEAINDSQYLIPRMTRDQRREAICGPATVAKGRISPRLVQRLLNDVGDNPDQLPIMQHALMRMWDYWQAEAKDGEHINLRHYEAIGGMHHALSLHADEAYDELAQGHSESEAQRRQQIAEKMFKFLAEKGSDNREVRRPGKLSDLAAVAEADEQEVIAVMDVFRKPGRSFLLPPISETPDSDTLIDISHESLIRNWQRLKQWADAEAQSAETYLRLAETAVLYKQGKTGIYRDPDLQIALDWQKRQKPNKTWAQSYHAGFDEGMTFLQRSDEINEAEIAAKEAQRHKQLRRRGIIAGVLGIAFVISLVLGIWANAQRREAHENILKANYNLAKVFEEKAGDAYDANTYQKAWLYTLAALNMDIPADSTLPISKARFSSSALIQKAFGNLWTSPHYTLDPISSVAFSPDGSLLAAGSADNMIRLWDVASGKTEAELKGHISTVKSIAFSPNGKYLASGSEDNTVRLWKVATGETVVEFTGHTGSVTSVAFSPDGKRLASSSEDSTVHLWNIATGKSVADFTGNSGPITSVVLSPDGKRLAFGSTNGTMHLCEVATGEVEAKFPGHTGSVASVVFSPDGKRLASGSADGTVHLWEVATGEAVAELIGHNGSVTSVVFSPDGKRLASSSADNTVHLWEIASKELVAKLKGHSDQVTSVAFSPDGQRLASGSADRTVRLWNVITGEIVAEPKGHTDQVLSVAFSPDGLHLASGSLDNTVRLWNIATGKIVAELIGHLNRVTSVAFSPDGQRLASGSGDYSVRLWEVATGEIVNVFKGHSGRVTSVAFSPDGQRLASGSSDKTVRLWDVATGEIVTKPKDHAFTVECIAFSPDGQRLASGSMEDNTVRLWDAASGKTIFELKGHTTTINSIAFSLDGQRLASGSADNTVRLWDIATGEIVAELKGHRTGVFSVAFSPDGKRLASGSGDNTVRLWEVATAETVAELKGHTNGVLGVAFSPDGRRMVTGSGDNTVRLWEVATAIALPEFKGHSDKIYSVAFSPDGQRLASGSLDKTARLWEVATGKTIAELKGHSLFVFTVAFSPDGTRLATGSGDRTVRLWDTATGDTVAQFKGHRSSVFGAAFSPDGTRLATTGSGDKTVRLWNVATGETVIQFQGHTNAVVGVAFSPDGTRLATGAQDNTVRLWNVVNGGSIAELKGHSRSVDCVVFSPDGQLLASGSRDNTVRLWDVATGKNVAELKGHTHAAHSVAFSPDGKRLASCSGDNSVRLWNVATGETEAELKGHTNTVWSVAFSPDGQLLASGSEDKTLRLWDVRQHPMPQSPVDFARIYEASFYLFQSRLQSSEIVPDKRPSDLMPVREGVFPKPGRFHKFRNLDRPRPLDKDPIEWILQNVDGAER